ncbi:MAG: metal ABC transporter substrate-binding protein [Acidimicrobiia bacterium]
MITILIHNRRLRTALRPVMAVSLLVLLTVGCGPGDDRGSDELTVVATTSIWGDVIGQIVGDEGRVEVLIPLGVDAHDYQATPQQLIALQTADLVVANGLGLEEGLIDVLKSAETDGANLYEVGADLEPLPLESATGDDPHVWFDPLRMAVAAGLIAERIAQIDPSFDWAARAQDYAEELDTVDAEISDILAGIAEPDRRLITNHDALGYFAKRYGFSVVGVVVPGGSTLSDPSSAELAALVDEMRRQGVRTIFAETTQPTRLAEAVAAEVGHEVRVVELYTESLGESGSGADTLVGMLHINATRIADALSG